MELPLSLLLLILSLLLAPTAIAQTGSSSGSGSHSGSRSYAAEYIILTSIVFVIIAASAVFYIRCYGNGCLGTFAANHQELPVAAAARGLDAAAVKSLPVIKFSDVKMRKIENVEIECAVCLSEVTDHDALLLLPNCGHVFHSDCIKPWLACHVTCPVCRASLEGVSSVRVSIQVLDRISRDVAKPSVHHHTVEIEGSSISN